MRFAKGRRTSFWLVLRRLLGRRDWTLWQRSFLTVPAGVLFRLFSERPGLFFGFVRTRRRGDVCEFMFHISTYVLFVKSERGWTFRPLKRMGFGLGILGISCQLVGFLVGMGLLVLLGWTEMGVVDRLGWDRCRGFWTFAKTVVRLRIGGA